MHELPSYFWAAAELIRSSDQKWDVKYVTALGKRHHSQSFHSRQNMLGYPVLDGNLTRQGSLWHRPLAMSWPATLLSCSL
jgi:hypothetical protein